MSTMSPATANARRSTGARSVVAAFAVALTIVVNPYVAFVAYGVIAINSPAVTEGPSMEPTLQGEHIAALDVLTYRTREPERGDIVVVEFAPLGESRLVKRIVGLPGEEITIRGDRVFIDGEELDEPYVQLPWSDRFDALLIPEGEYFVMGDNRANSFDSREQLLGTVPREDIEGLLVTNFSPWVLGLLAIFGAVALLGMLVTGLVAVRRGRALWWALLGAMGGVGLAIVYLVVRRPAPLRYAAPLPYTAMAVPQVAALPPFPGAVPQSFEAGPPPVGASEEPTVVSVAPRLRQLRLLRDEGLITEEQFEARRRAIVEEI